ncbi:MAG: hypothetical protein LBQ54_07625 [Planctomycetaceae bacterium]|jgi:transcriptional regulator NrdR family protein|nr:hypothetical protein [Planctomycetaceae bacterium]
MKKSVTEEKKVKREGKFPCPKCGRKTFRVYKTKTYDNGVVKRIRLCEMCGFSQNTKEQIEEKERNPG